MLQAQKIIDPRTTRRLVDLSKYARDSALYSTYEVVGYQGPKDAPNTVVLQKKPQFCKR